MKHIELQELTKSDAEFIFKLVNQPSFKKYIGDKGVYDIESAAKHLDEKYIQPYKQYGYGLWGIKDRDLDCYVGVCGLVTRPEFTTPDLGYSLLDEYTKQGYIAIAARKAIELARDEHGLRTLNAITSPDNHASIRVLDKLGFKFQKQFELSGYSGVSNLYQRVL